MLEFPFSQIVPPSPSPSESKSPLYTSVSFFLSCIQGRHCHLFHSTLSPSSRDSLVPLTFCHKGGVICVSEVVDISPAILIPAWVSSSLAFHMMYSARKVSKQGNNTQTWHTPFPIWNQSVVPCRVLTIASWPAYRFLRRQVRCSGIPISWRIFHSLLWSIVKGYV